MVEDTSSTLVKRALEQTFDKSSWLINMSRDERKRELTKAMHRKNLADVWVYFEAWLYLFGKKGGRVSENTLKNYRAGLATLFEFLERRGENALRPIPELGLYFREWLVHEGYSPSTINLKMTTARNLYDALSYCDVTNDNPFSKTPSMPDPTEQHEKRQAYTHDEVQALLGKAEGDMRKLIVLTAFAGLRLFEALKLTPSDITRVGKQWTASIVGKGLKVRTVPLAMPIVKELRLGASELRQASARDIPFISISQRDARRELEILCQKAKTRYLAIHSFRHFFATHLYDSGTNLEVISRLLGHSSSVTTSIYAKMRSEAIHNEVDRVFG